MTIAQVIEHKQGSTWVYSVECKNDDGTPFDLTEVEIHGQIRDLDHALISTLTCNKTDAASGKWSIGPVDTTSWPLKSLKHDVLYIKNGIKVHSDTVVIKVIQAETEV